MRLVKLDYSQHVETDKEWRFRNLALGNVNLLVGQNATGKSRTLKIIDSLAQFLRGDRKIREADWTAVFRQDGKHTLVYALKICNGIVASESVVCDGVSLLSRESNGEGLIYSNQLKKQMQFKVSEAIPAAIAKRDEIQHSFLEPLHSWAAAVRYHRFGTTMGKERVEVLNVEHPLQFDSTDVERIVGLLWTGKDKYGSKFSSLVVKYMNRIGYQLDSVGVEDVQEIESIGPLVRAPIGLYVKERDLRAKTTQVAMSQGMFRALAIVVHTAYAELSGEAACVIVDDIGEGLDFERSTNLIKLIVERAKKKGFQLIMATNDRSVMNAVPLESWYCLRRCPAGIEVLDYANSKKLFDDFAMTGLANFDFLTTGYFNSERAADA